MSMEAILAPYLVSYWGRRVAKGAIGLAAVLLLCTLVEGIIWIATLPSSLKAVQVSVPHTHIQSPPDLATLHLFGAPVTVVGSNDVASLPPTALQLTLHGLFTNTRTKMSEALISAPGQSTKAYHVGSSVPGGATVYEILDDGVVLQRGGKLEKLILPVHPLHFGVPPTQMNFETQTGGESDE